MNVIADFTLLPLSYTSCMGGNMGVKTVVVKYSPKAEKMAKRIEDKINEMEALGYEFITCSINGSAKAILIFKDRLEETEKQQEA